ncbi:hypothetical protein CSC17_1697 [Klebsiella oxytoca]|jgi:hypothetical protein|nr:hypothetical protein CSC17_1697 [Klebsiella oxytoca]
MLPPYKICTVGEYGDVFIHRTYYLPAWYFYNLMFNDTLHKVAERDENKIKAISDR